MNQIVSTSVKTIAQRRRDNRVGWLRGSSRSSRLKTGRKASGSGCRLPFPCDARIRCQEQLAQRGADHGCGTVLSRPQGVLQCDNTRVMIRRVEEASLWWRGVLRVLQAIPPTYLLFRRFS